MFEIQDLILDVLEDLIAHCFVHSFILANDQSILAGKVDSFSITIGVCLDLEDAASVGDEVLSGCGSMNPGMPTNGEGAYNEALLDVNNDGMADDTSSACDDVPYLSFCLLYTSPSPRDA